MVNYIALFQVGMVFIDTFKPVCDKEGCFNNLH